MELISLMSKTTLRLIQFRILKNVVNPLFLGGFYFRKCDGISRLAVLLECPSLSVVLYNDRKFIVTK